MKRLDRLVQSFSLSEMPVKYGIIEEFTEGLYQEPKSVYYYKFNKEMRVYEKIDEPKEWKEIGNFAIG